MNIVIAGGSGFIGRNLTELLLDNGHQVVILTRKDQQPTGNVSYVKWLRVGAFPENDIRKADVIINLAGVSINAGRWSRIHQKQIYESRMTATDELLRTIANMQEKPKVLINASAIGIYPASEKAVYTEDSLETADDFLGRTVYDWENQAKKAEIHGIRVVMMRFGVVLGNEGGALPLMALPYKMFAGGTVGKGEQWVSWVHVIDVVRAIQFAMENERLVGPINVTSPFPLKMKDFGKTIGAVLHRPHWLPVPSLALKLALGQKSKLVLEGQLVLPQRLMEEGFEYRFPSLQSALKDILLNKR